MTVRLPIIVFVAAILLSAATAFVLASITQPASSDAAPGGTSAIVSQLKKLNKKVATSNSELADVNARLGVGGDVMGFLHDIERHTAGTCDAVSVPISPCTTIYSSPRPFR